MRNSPITETVIRENKIAERNFLYLDTVYSKLIILDIKLYYDI